MQIAALWFTLLAFAALAIADVSITTPKSGGSFSASGGSTSITVTWVDDSDDSASDTSLANVKSYALVLCTGTNTNIQSIKTFTTTLLSSALTYTASVDAKDAPNGVYFIQVYATFVTGHTIHYTNRFALTGMSASATTYTFSGNLFSVTGDQPSPQAAVGTDSTVDTKSFTVPYTEQTGSTRYAPMQLQPGSVLTVSAYSTRHPTSAYTPYSTLRPSPNVYSTLTQGWSYTASSQINTASVAGYPTYFYAASSRVQQAVLSSAKKRRWLD